MAMLLKRAIRKREAFIQNITECYRMAQNAKTDPVSKERFRVRFQNLENDYENFYELHNEVISEIPEDAEDEFKVQDRIRSEVLNFYYESKIVHNQLSPNSGVATRNDSVPKLKELGIPIFRGDKTLWPTFFDLYNNLVHQNTSLSNVRKFQHLLSYLESEPLRLLSGISITEVNYEIAYNKLVGRYQNKRLIANDALGALMKATLKNESAKELRALIDTFSQSLEVLKALSFDINSWDYLLLFILIEKLDVTTRTNFETANGHVELPTYQSLYLFLENKCKALESLQHLNPIKSKTSYQVNQTNSFTKGGSKPHPTFSALATGNIPNIKCFKCEQPHVLSKCPAFLRLSSGDRLAFINQKKFCTNCLHPSHDVNSCTSKFACRNCSSKRHHTLLHIFKNETQELPNKVIVNSQKSQPSVAVNESSTSFSGNVSLLNQGTFLLATAVVDMLNGSGTYQSVRIIIDSGSQASFISENCLRRLTLPRRHFSTEIQGLNQMSSFTSKGQAYCHIKPQGKSEPLLSFEAIVVPNLCTNMPSFTIENGSWKHLNGLQLADPLYFQSNPVDVLVGCEIFAQLLKEGKILGRSGQPSAIETIFGWILMGKVNSINSVQKTSSFFVHCETPLEVILPKFWEVENIPQKALMSIEDHRAETIFCETVRRLPAGRFMVDLPFKDSAPDLGNTYSQALRRFLCLESRLIKDPELYSAYSDFMRGYIEAQHMSIILPNAPKPQFSSYLPHHCVLKPDSVSTKLRVVWDCSAKGSTGVSLNQTLLSGPKLQNDISSLLLTFRLHSIAFVADIQMMFRQVLISPHHRPFQRILWRFSAQESISEYELNTVTFGMTCSPFLAMRALIELANLEKERFPRASEVLKSSTYIDDILCTSASISDAFSLQRELTDLLRSGGFELKKWASNCSELLAPLPLSDLQLPFSFEKDEPQFIKVLGLQWQPKTDTFSYRCHINDKPITKRSILSTIGTMFDPLGFLCPLLLKAKSIMQQLWISRLGWDEILPPAIVNSWTELHSELPLLTNVQLPRQITLSKINSVQIHAFCDASLKGYASVIYFRTEDEGNIVISLICAKARVAPIKVQTLARLELLGAVLLSDLIQFVMDTYSNKISISGIYAWCDSQIVLHWLASQPSRWKTFVANRVSHIQEIVPYDSWHYIPSNLNAADAASRGMTPSQLIANEMWWKSSYFLWLPENEWPQFHNVVSTSCDSYDHNSEERQNVFHVVFDTNFIDILIEKYSCLSKIQRILSYVIRIKNTFLKRSYQKPFKLSTDSQKILENIQLPNPDEMQISLFVLVQHVQSVCFSELRSNLSKAQPIPKLFRKLSPFLDREGLIRVGGRLQKSEILSYGAKHPLLLPSAHRFTTLVIEEVHKRYLHPGLQTLHHLLLQRYWILSGRKIIRRILSKCLQCFRVNPKPFQPPIMSSLPFQRINQLKPFSHIAIDFCGPFSVTPCRRRGSRSIKSYVCVFVCTSVRCIHLELTTDLSTEGFIAAFRRFISRRGSVTDCWSDQGSNFIGFHNQLITYAQETCEKLSIRWHFGPPYSPHFNGLAEAGVKSFKTHYVRVVGAQLLSIEEMSTIMCQIEAVLNSRPLTAQSCDPNDLQPLTPGHFLTLEPLNSNIPNPDLSHLPINRLSRWQLVQQMHFHFWKRYSLEYLHTLQQRFKWSNPSSEIKPNDLVLISSELRPPLKWPIGRVLQLHPGDDGHVRVASVKTATGIVKRPVVKLCPLPQEN